MSQQDFPGWQQHGPEQVRRPSSERRRSTHHFTRCGHDQDLGGSRARQQQLFPANQDVTKIVVELQAAELAAVRFVEVQHEPGATSHEHAAARRVVVDAARRAAYGDSIRDLAGGDVQRNEHSAAAREYQDAPRRSFEHAPRLIPVFESDLADREAVEIDQKQRVAIGIRRDHGGAVTGYE